MTTLLEILNQSITYLKNNMQKMLGLDFALVVSTLQTLQQCRSSTQSPKLNLIWPWIMFGSLVFSG